MEKAIVRAATLVLFLLASYGLGAPVSKVQELDKRRESTPEILNLEQQLKKAAGEDKQYFSATEARPMPQIDGLATDEQDNASPVDEEYGLLDDVIEPSPEGDGQLPDRIKTYDQLWDIVKQHPEYMRTILHDYLGNTDQLDRIGPADYEIPKRDASDELSYPSDGRLEPAMDDVYRGSDDDDRADSLIADYMVPPAQQQFGRADGRMEEQDEETNMDDLDEGEEDEEDEDGEGEDGDDDDEEDEEQDDEEEEDEDDKLDEDVDDDEEEDDEDEQDEDQSDDEEEEEEDDEEEEDEDEENVKERKSNSVEDENDDDDDDDEEDDEEDEQEDGNEADDEEDEADEEEEDDDEEGEEDELDSLNSKQAKEESKGDIKAVSAAVNEMEEAVNEGKAKPSASQKHEPYKMWQNIGDVVVPPMM